MSRGYQHLVWLGCSWSPLVLEHLILVRHKIPAFCPLTLLPASLFSYLLLVTVSVCLLCCVCHSFSAEINWFLTAGRCEQYDSCCNERIQWLPHSFAHYNLQSWARHGILHSLCTFIPRSFESHCVPLHHTIRHIILRETTEDLSSSHSYIIESTFSKTRSLRSRT